MLEPWQIVEAYTQKIRGLINYYYHNIVNKSALSYYYYLIKYSCLKTLANKKKSSIKGIITTYGSNIKIKYNSFTWDVDNNKEKKIEHEIEFPSYINLMNWAGDLSIKKINERIESRMAEPKKEKKIHTMRKDMNLKGNELENVFFEKKEQQYDDIKFNLRSGFQSRKWCVICYEPDGTYNPIQTHHIKALKNGNINGIDNIMKALNRKTIPVCKNCHRKIHNKEYNGTALGKIMDRILVTI